MTLIERLEYLQRFYKPDSPSYRTLQDAIDELRKANE